MEQYPFIFSNKLYYRLLRHVAFWFCWWLFSSFLYAYTPFPGAVPPFQRLIISGAEAFVFLAVHMFVTYSLVYFVVPYLLIKGQYLYSFIAVIIIFLATGVINAFISPHVGDLRNYLLSPFFQNTLPDRPEHTSFHYTLLAGLRGGITIAGLAAAIKLMKYWYVKEQRNLQLQKENSEAQLQLLKAQIHPHFLFNTMNNIYSFTQNTSPVAAKMVSGLSDMLRYMLYEGNKRVGPLAKELTMLEEYIMLEKVRYGNNLEIHTEVHGNTNDLYIAPLLLLPLVENCFKHGASNMVEQPWINMRIDVNGNWLSMKLVNGKASNYQPKTSMGIGLKNVQQRLALLYPEKHSFKITNEEEIFIVDLKIELERIAVTRQELIQPLIPAHV